MMGPVTNIILLIFNFFLIESIFNYLNHPLNKITILSIVIIIAANSTICMTLELKKSRKITRILMELNELWKWASLMYFIELILLYFLNIFIKIPLSIKYTIFLTIVPLIGIIGYYIAHHNHIKQYDLYLEEKTKNSKDITIIHISDLHIGSIQSNKLLKNLVKNLNKIALNKQKENTDIITIISGDIADGSTPIKPDTFIEFKKAIMPIIFTPGNHDYYLGINSLNQALKNAGIIILDNKSLNLKNHNLNIIGLSYSFEKTDSIKLNLKENENNIIIYHEPTNWKKFTNMGIDIQLSGHTHGGQFFPANYIVKQAYSYNKGLFQKKIQSKTNNKIRNSYLSVTTGVGTNGPPIRLGTKSEIIILNIKRINY